MHRGALQKERRRSGRRGGDRVIDTQIATYQTDLCSCTEHIRRLERTIAALRTELSRLRARR